MHCLYFVFNHDLIELELGLGYGRSALEILCTVWALMQDALGNAEEALTYLSQSSSGFHFCFVSFSKFKKLEIVYYNTK